MKSSNIGGQAVLEGINEKNGQMVTPEANNPKRPSNMLELQW